MTPHPSAESLDVPRTRELLALGDVQVTRLFVGSAEPPRDGMSALALGIDGIDERGRAVHAALSLTPSQAEQLRATVARVLPDPFAPAPGTTRELTWAEAR